MTTKIIQFPLYLYNSLNNLVDRGFMTPSYLSRIIMLAVLPAKFVFDEDGNEQTNLLSSALKSLFEKKGTNSNPIYTEERKLIEGIETIEEKSSNNSSLYEIYFCGNGQDANWKPVTIKNEDNHIFWNYPGVCKSMGGAHSAYHLFEAGYKQVKNLINKGIHADKITLVGHSLGGGVATHVARRLHEEGYLVNLVVDRSFSCIAKVVPASINNYLKEDYHVKYAPLITSIIALGVSGIALGTTFAGLIASFSLLTKGLYFDIALNLLGSIVGGLISICGLLAGSLIGLIVGSILSLQLLFTDKPYTMPMTFAFSAVLYSACCEMNSLGQMQRLLNADKKYPNATPVINVINVKDDEVIDVSASLNTGLGFNLDEHQAKENLPLKNKINSFWYRKGGHNGCIYDKRNLITPSYSH